MHAPKLRLSSPGVPRHRRYHFNVNFHPAATLTRERDHNAPSRAILYCMRLQNEQQSAMTASTLRESEGALQPSSTQTSMSTNLGPTGTESHAQPRGAGTATANEPLKHQPDTISDRATSAFVRRTLCSQNVLLGNGEKGRTTPRPIEDVLPPLTSSNEVDLQLYGIISVIIKEFVQTWYSKITPDHVFVDEVLQIIAHCTRALEQRLRKVDLEAVLLDEIPELLEAHLSSM
jgi:hypothetical protein